MNQESLSTFKLMRRYLTLVGFWQTKQSSWLYFIYGIIMHLIFCDIFTLLMIIYLFNFETFEDFASVMSFLPTFLALFAKSINLMMSINEIELLFELVNDGTAGFKTQIIDKRIKTLRKIYICFVSSGFATCVASVFVPFIDHALPYRMWFPYDYKNVEVLFWLSASYQIVITCIISGVDITMDTLPIFFMSTIYGMLEQLQEKMENLKQPKNLLIDGPSITRINREENSKELLKCIKYHLKIIEITRKVERRFSIVLLAQGFMSTLIMCTTAYALTIVSSLIFNIHELNIHELRFRFLRCKKPQFS